MPIGNAQPYWQNDICRALHPKRPRRLETQTMRRASPCRGLNPGHPGGLVTPRHSGVIFIYLFSKHSANGCTTPVPHQLLTSGSASHAHTPILGHRLSGG
eukprot:jgi/Chrzof1/5352/UNPLg00817.t1